MRVQALVTAEDAQRVRAELCAWTPPRGVSRAVLDEWQWILRSRVTNKDSDLLHWMHARARGRPTHDEWWVARAGGGGAVEGVLQVRPGDAAGPKIHGLLARRPGGGAGTRLVRRALALFHRDRGRDPGLWVGAHPAARGFYAKLGFRPVPGARTKPSEIPMAPR